MSTSAKSHIGKEDFKIQTNTNSAESFTRLASTGDSVTMTKFPDLWDGTGLLNIGELEVRALDDNDTILHGFCEVL